jgi:hypothetical protein
MKPGNQENGSEAGSWFHGFLIETKNGAPGLSRQNLMKAEVTRPTFRVVRVFRG